MSRFCYYCNPEVLDKLKKVLRSEFAPYPPEMPVLPSGFELEPNAAVPLHPTRWQFPKERFVTYEPSDEPWCRYFGIGRDVQDTTKYLFIRIQDRFWDRPFALAVLAQKGAGDGV